MESRSHIPDKVPPHPVHPASLDAGPAGSNPPLVADRRCAAEPGNTRLPPASRSDSMMVDVGFNPRPVVPALPQPPMVGVGSTSRPALATAGELTGRTAPHPTREGNIFGSSIVLSIDK